MKMKKTIFAIILFAAACINAQEISERGICAHRGASADYPENTLLAISEAVHAGVQMIEFDVRRTADNYLVIMHNTDVSKTTEGTGSVASLSFEEISKLDAGSWKGPQFKGLKIPTFAEVLDIIPSGILMNIHIKEDAATAFKVAEFLTERKQTANAVLAIENEAVDGVRKINPGLKICSMSRGDSPEQYVENALAVKADFVQLTVREFPVLEKVIPVLKEHGIKINYYYTDKTEDLNHLFETGVDYVLTNKAAVMLKEVKRNKNEKRKN